MTNDEAIAAFKEARRKELEEILQAVFVGRHPDILRTIILPTDAAVEVEHNFPKLMLRADAENGVHLALLGLLTTITTIVLDMPTVAIFGYPTAEEMLEEDDGAITGIKISDKYSKP